VRIALVGVLVAGCRIHFDPVTLPDADGATSSDALDEFCAQQTTLLCDDFSAMPNANLYGNTMWLATGSRNGGGVIAHADPGGGSGALYTFPVVTSGTIHARAYANVHAGPQIQGFSVLVELNNGINTGGNQKVSADLETNDFYGIGAPFTGTGALGTATVTRGSWLCIELTVVMSATAGEMRVSVDGTEVAAKTGANTQIPSGFNTVILSATVSAGDPAITTEYDDLIVATVPIGC
jgi:hypothetical protein